MNIQSHKWAVISHRLYHNSSLMWCAILEESLSMYGGVWNFIKTIIFALFVTTCKKGKKKEKKV